LILFFSANEHNLADWKNQYLPFPDSPLKDLMPLTLREKDLLRLMGQGCTNREIATQLHLAEGTIKTYVIHLFDRLNLKNRSQVAIYTNSIASALNR
jgi:DNA-binding NarL/FixJ family response regulator